jgi:hypothetical protein
MSNTDILQPLFALAFWTSFVLLLIPIARFRAAFRRQVVSDDFKHGESGNVPPHVSLPNRNYMNLLELPVLFYVAGVLIYVTGGATPAMLMTAWAYVGLRVLHSLIHLTYNHVIQRMLVFATSNFVLVALWVLAGFKIFVQA